MQHNTCFYYNIAKRKL